MMTRKEYDEQKALYQTALEQAEKGLAVPNLSEKLRNHWEIIKAQSIAFLKITDLLGSLGYDDNEVYREGERQLDTRMDCHIMHGEAMLNDYKQTGL